MSSLATPSVLSLFVVFNVACSETDPAPRPDSALTDDAVAAEAHKRGLSAGKAVFHVEYKPATKSSVCSKIKPLKLSSTIKNPSLDAWFDACWN